MMFWIYLVLKQFLIKQGKDLSSLLTGDDGSLSFSKSVSNNFKENFPNHKGKHIGSLNSCHEVKTKTMKYVMVYNKQEQRYKPKPSAVRIHRIRIAKLSATSTDSRLSKYCVKWQMSQFHSCTQKVSIRYIRHEPMAHTETRTVHLEIHQWWTFK